ncbi:MAG: Arm DNA-binding domain-containing protein, partial [Alphaproteobacteria bacterium]|nr:Arm DNA-binding domain-containing protein [Alphaproteobacteria bacterium]
MPKRKITKTFLERSIKIPATGQVDYFDTATTGFGVRASYDGTKSFFVMGRLSGKKVRHTLSPSYNKGLSVDAARTKAKAALQQLADGLHPRDAAEKQAAEAAKRRADTYGKTVDEFIDKFHQGRKKNRTWKESKRLLLWPRGGKPPGRETKIDIDDHLWKGRPVSEITKGEIIALLDAIVADDKGYTANRAYAAMNT